jgi:hypothetical protein
MSYSFDREIGIEERLEAAGNPPRRESAPGWTVTAGNSKVTGKFVILEHSSGWKITHCGHATANWPYYLTAPDRLECIVSHNGRGFKSREIAKDVVSKILAGEYKLTTEDCCPNIATVENVTAFGEFIGKDGRPQ